MEVITIEHAAFKRLEDMYMEAKQIIKNQADAISGFDIVLLDSNKVAELTGYNEKTIRLHKEEIGYHTRGKNILFKPKDVEIWINKNYRGPKPRKY